MVAFVKELRIRGVVEKSHFERPTSSKWDRAICRPSIRKKKHLGPFSAALARLCLVDPSATQCTFSKNDLVAVYVSLLRVFAKQTEWSCGLLRAEAKLLKLAVDVTNSHRQLTHGWPSPFLILLLPSYSPQI